MDFDVEHEILSRYAPLFGLDGGIGQKQSWGIECGNGWSTLLVAMCSALEMQSRRTRRPIFFQYIKQKYGILHCTLVEPDDYCRGALDAIMWMSYVTCENCGNRGTLARGNQGWIRVLCPPCRQADPA